MVFPIFRLKYKKMFKPTSSALTFVALNSLLMACSSTPPRTSETQQVSSQEAGIELVAPEARTQNPRQRRVFQDARGGKVLARVESDFNGDGRIDFIQSFDAAGQWVQLEKSDLDGDGRFDVTSVFVWDAGRKAVRLTEQHFDTNYDGNVDLWKEFDERGRLVLRKLDRDFDERADYWEHYDNGQAVRIEEDRNGDGQPDKVPAPRTSRR